MQISKKAAIGMLSLGLVVGTAGAIGLSVHAQQSQTTQQPVQAQVQQPATAVVAQQPEVKTSTDTDNIQDPVGQGEQPDAVTGQTEQPGTETADSKTETPDNGASGGHQDQGNANHQLEGQE